MDTPADLAQPGLGLPVETLRSRRNSKWTRYGPDILPAWIAEMDFVPAPAIQRAMERLTESGDYGYPWRQGRAELAVSLAFVERMQARFGWAVDVDLVQPVADLVQATFATVMAFSEPGDGVHLHLPAYGPFHESIHSTGRRLVIQRLRDTGAGYAHDDATLRDVIDPQTRIIILCNPQNPTGHVFTRTELESIGRVAVERDLLILSDEIHADLVFDGRRHIPIASLGPEVAARTVTITSATKSFNIPGLRCAVMHFGAAELRDRFLARMPRRLLGAPGVYGIDATVAAWTESQDWLDAVLRHLQAMRDRLMDTLADRLPAIRCHRPEATYMAWLDCTALDLPGTAFDFFHDRARVALNPGEVFDPECSQFVRLNFATSADVLDAILERMAAAVEAR